MNQVGRQARLGLFSGQRSGASGSPSRLIPSAAVVMRPGERLAGHERSQVIDGRSFLAFFTGCADGCGILSAGEKISMNSPEPRRPAPGGSCRHVARRWRACGHGRCGPLIGPQQVTIGEVEPLTERELEVLRHVSGMLSSAEGAREMYISINTAKTHLRNIYRKLAATHRGNAVRRARQLELI